MSEESDESDNSQDRAPSSKVYKAGTLVYTKAALAILLCWLLWGDFCYTLMEAVTGPIMQLKFQALHASNTEVGIIIGTIPGLVYSFLNPIISFRSDRFRSRWGRRIPFILFSLPFLVLGLVGLAFGSRIAFWLYAHLPFLRALSADQFAIMLLGALLIGFTFFNTFVTTTFWYLFNDVVPEQLLARFVSWFRTVSILSASLYSYFIFPHSATHSCAIFLGAALLYLVGFGLMCYHVKEGEYPPPPPYVGGQTGPIAAIKTYAVETHAFPHYWYLWICTFIGSIGGGVGLFNLYFMESIGLNLQQIGNKDGTYLLIVSLLTLGAGWLADRFHPIRIVLAGSTISLLLVMPANMIWIFWHPSPHVAFWVVMAIAIGLSAPAAAMTGMWDPPMLMRLFPRSQYGQFCSANGVWRTMGGLCGGALTGGYLDIVTRYVGKQRAYAYLPVWSICFAIPAYLLLIRLYHSWKKHGGDDAYIAPTLENIPLVAPISYPVEEISL